VQLIHWYVNVIGCGPLHVPGLPVNALPTRCTPEIVGACSFRGGAWGVAADAATIPPDASVVSTDAINAVAASRRRARVNLLHIRPPPWSIATFDASFA
jgi:hypothetical protein